MPLLRNISQLATCPSGNPQQDAGLIRDAALVWRNGLIRWAGRYADLPSRYAAEPVIDCERRLVVPGLVDCHTHLCFGGWRGDEFEARLEGATYQDIAAAGGGIAHTVAATRRSSIGELQRKAKAVLDAMLRLGVTTVECKSGYGLDEANELKQLEVYRRLDLEHPVDLVPTFLGAHIIPLDTASTHFVTDPTRTRKLLLHKRELAKILAATTQKGQTCVCTQLYWKGHLVKARIALAAGKQSHDKRATEKARDWQREKSRIMRGR